MSARVRTPGPKGDPGAAGEPGAKGVPGAAGQDGATGLPGVNGATWLHMRVFRATSCKPRPATFVSTPLSGGVYQKAQGDMVPRPSGSGREHLRSDGTDGRCWTEGRPGSSWSCRPCRRRRCARRQGRDGRCRCRLSPRAKGRGRRTVPPASRGRRRRGDGGPAGLPGAQGSDGATWLAGTDAPNEVMGDNGDFFLDTANGCVYRKSGDAWAQVADLTGPQGEQGPQGPVNPNADKLDGYDASDFVRNTPQ